MALTVVARIIDAARVQAPGALEGTLRAEFFNTAKEFCQRSDIWREDITIPVQANWAFYELPALSQGLVSRLMWLEGQRPTNTSGPPQYGPARKGWLERTGRTALLRLEPPSSAETWTAHVSLTVVDPTDSEGMPLLPDWIAEKYQDYFASGLLMRLAMHPGKPYSNRELAVFHGRKFMEGIATARKEARTGHIHGGQRWVFPQTFASHSQKVR